MVVAAVILIVVTIAAVVLIIAVWVYCMPGKRGGEKQVRTPTSPRLLEDKNTEH